MAMTDKPCLMCGGISIRHHFVKPAIGKLGYYRCQTEKSVAPQPASSREQSSREGSGERVTTPA